MKDWEKAYQEGVTPWDKGYASPPLAQWLQNHILKGEGLVLGCGLGHDVRLFSKNSARVTGMDISHTAINEAKKIPVVNNESYKVADFLI
jgi:2-polyprenyl-3-methyl-5-hydroxy-6-metoxy-1,4-benzoquinol methylase